MSNIRVDLSIPIYDGLPVTFKSPADCSQVTGLIIYYPEGETTTSKTFLFADAHGNNIGNLDLFASNAVVKVILDTDTNLAFVQNADTNAYLESRFDGKANNPNLLDNWYFVDPINQRGATTWSKSGYSHMFNRWEGYTESDGSISIVDEGVELNRRGGAAVTLRQKLESQVLCLGSTYTISFISDNELFTKTFTWDGSQKILAFYSGSDYFSVTQSSLVIHCVTSKVYTIKAVKLELGSQQTLARQDENGNWVLNDPPPDKNMELLKCIQSKADSTDTFANKTIATGYTCNKNLLDNWYFKDPINQRGKTLVPPGTPYYHYGSSNLAGETTDYTTWFNGNDGQGHTIFVLNPSGASCWVDPTCLVPGYKSTQYTIDRWAITSGTGVAIIPTDKGLLLRDSVGGGYIQHHLDPNISKSLVGRQVTFSALDSNGNLYQKTAVIPSTSNWGITSLTINSIAMHLCYNGKKVIIQTVTNKGETYLTAVKLELGSEQTLAHKENGKWVLNEIPDKNEELLKCCMSTADSTDTYANNNKTSAAINAFNKSGDTMTGPLDFKAFNNGLGSIKKNHSDSADYGLQLRDYDKNGNYCILTLRGMDGLITFSPNSGGDSYAILHTGNKADYVSFKTTATIPVSGWAEHGVGWKQTINVSGIKSSDKPIVGYVGVTTQTGTIAVLESWRCVTNILAYDGYMEIICDQSDKPQVDIPIQILCVR